MKMWLSTVVLCFALCSSLIYAATVTPHCGRKEKRIVGGEASDDGEWPWLVSIMVSIPVGTARRHVCGGTLISDRWVLSAAHCFNTALNGSLSTTAGDYTIRIGEYNLYDDDTQHVDYTPELIIANDFDYPNTMINDIALIKLPSAVVMGDRVNVACLPDTEDVYPSSCTVAGWGHQVENGTVSDVVRHVEVNLVDNTECARLNSEIAPYIPDWSGVLCAGNTETGGKDSCQYDSGGPLVCYDEGEDEWVLAGVVSVGMGCGNKDHPGIYTSVKAYDDWLQDTMRDN